MVQKHTRSAWIGALLGASAPRALDMFRHVEKRPAWPLLADCVKST